jgi:hypothetical protein
MEMTLSIAVQLVDGHADYANIRDSPRTDRLRTPQTPDVHPLITISLVNWRNPFAEQDLKMMMPSSRQQNSGSDALVQSFTVLAYRL